MTCLAGCARILSIASVMVLVANSAWAAPTPGAHHPTRILVKLRPPSGGSAASGGRIESVAGMPVVKSFRTPGLMAVNADRPFDEALALLRKQPEVLYAEPDYVIRATQTPNDPSFPLLWGLENTGVVIEGDPGLAGADARATQAWDYWQGDQDFRIAVLDTGIDYTHSDLVANTWTNPGEIPGNGVDDDNNGYIDDVHGYRFDGGPGADPADDHGHGTHVAGILGARGNNGIGVTGVNWRCRLVPIKILDSTGQGFTSDAVSGLEYAVANGIKVSNNSWACYSCFSQSLKDAIEAAGNAGHLFVAAAGNGILGVSTNTDDFPNYPSGYDLPNIIAVAASDQKDRKAIFSNDGLISVDLAAPGVNILSTHLSDQYLLRSGTSMATPFVTGAAALAWSRLPALTPIQVKERILLTARPVPAFLAKTATGGILDIAAAVADCNHNGVLDDSEIASGAFPDCNGNLLLDVCEHDCNGNLLEDGCDIKDGTSADCDGNGVPDECDPDCNANRVPDECEPGHDVDCNGNKKADLCDIASGAGEDCNANGTLDECDIDAMTSADCTHNNVPDECEPDCNGNGVADSCDIDSGFSADLDENSIPDECAGFSVVPVQASGMHYISNNEVRLVRGAQRLVAELRLSGWDPDQDGDPLLDLYQADFEIPDLDMGSDAPLHFAALTCANNDDCIGDSVCVDGMCDIYGSLNVDTAREDYVFAGLDVIATSAIEGREFPEVFALLIDSIESVFDDGETHYGATLVLDSREDAVGAFEIGFAEKLCTMTGGDLIPIPIPGFHPMSVIIQDGYDLADFAEWQSCFGMNDESVGCIDFDANADNRVDSQDFGRLLSLFSGPLP